MAISGGSTVVGKRRGLGTASGKTHGDWGEGEMKHFLKLLRFSFPASLALCAQVFMFSRLREILGMNSENV